MCSCAEISSKGVSRVSEFSSSKLQRDQLSCSYQELLRGRKLSLWLEKTKSSTIRWKKKKDRTVREGIKKKSITGWGGEHCLLRQLTSGLGYSKRERNSFD